MIEELFATGNSLIHRINPKIRILCAGALSIAAALCNHMIILLGYLLISIILIFLANLRLIHVMKRIKPVAWFLLMIWLIVPVTFDGQVIFQVGFLKFTGQGIELCAMISLKSIAIVLIFTALIATMPIASLGAGLHQLKVPDKLVFLLLMSYRYIDVIEKEYTKLLRAAKFRGFVPGTNLHSYKTFAYLAGMLFVRASLRAQRVYQAMICRGFNGKFYTLDVYPPNRLNSAFLAVIVVAGLVLTYIDLFRMGT